MKERPIRKDIDIKDVERHIKERGLPMPAVPERAPQAEDPSATAERQTKERQRGVLQASINELHMQMQVARNRLHESEPKHPLSETVYEGIERERSATMNEASLEQLRNKMLGIEMKLESLHEALEAIQRGRPLPKDLPKVLQSLNIKWPN